jgi:hypothetical protein
MTFGSVDFCVRHWTADPQSDIESWHLRLLDQGNVSSGVEKSVQRSFLVVLANDGQVEHGSWRICSCPGAYLLPRNVSHRSSLRQAGTEFSPPQTCPVARQQPRLRHPRNAHEGLR